MDEHKDVRVRTVAPILKGGDIKLFTIFDIEIHLNYTWFIVVLLVAWSLTYGYFPQQVPGRSILTYWGLGLITSIIFFLCILVHEISHSYVSKKLGIPVPRITLFIFGGVAQISREPPDPDTEFKIAVAGPLASAVLWGLFFGLSFLFARIYLFPLLASVFSVLSIVNAAVALFNLVPGFPLDGGRLLRAYIWKRRKNIREATFITAQVGRVFAIGSVSYTHLTLPTTPYV